MGAEESKISGTNKNRLFPCYTPFTSSVKCWTIIHQCPLEMWKKFHKESFNFSENIIKCPFHIPEECTSYFCLSRQNFINFHKRKSLFEPSKQKKQSKLAAHLEYNHIPAHLSSIQNLHFKSILCSLNGIAIFHLAKDLLTQFGIIDLRIHKFLGSFGKQPVAYSPDSVIAQISPDCKLCLLRLPWVRNNTIATLQLYSLETRELLSELPLIPFQDAPSINSTPLVMLNFQHNILARTDGLIELYHAPTDHFPQQRLTSNLFEPNTKYSLSSIIFAFDPRFANSRIVLANMKLQKHASKDNIIEFHSSNKPSLSLVQLPSWNQLNYTQLFSDACNSPLDRDFPATWSARRRRQTALDRQNHLNPSGNSTGSLSILRIFFSRAGHLLFVVLANGRVCRCSSIYSVFPSSIANNSTSPTPQQTVGANTSCQREVGSCPTTALMRMPPRAGCTSFFLNILNPDTLSHLRVIRFDRPVCPLHTCPTNYMPTMSVCGSRIALIGMSTISLSPDLPRLSMVSSRNVVSTRRKMSTSTDNLANIPRASTNQADLDEPHNEDMLRGSCDCLSCAGGLEARLGASVPRRVKWDRSGIQEEQILEPQRKRHHHSLPSAHAQEASKAKGMVRSTVSSSQLEVAISQAHQKTAFVFVYQLEPPPTLQAIVRERILQLHTDEYLDHLDLPLALIAYLRFNSTESCPGLRQRQPTAHNHSNRSDLMTSSTLATFESRLRLANSACPPTTTSSTA